MAIDHSILSWVTHSESMKSALSEMDAISEDPIALVAVLGEEGVGKKRACKYLSQKLGRNEILYFEGKQLLETHAQEEALKRIQSVSNQSVLVSEISHAGFGFQKKLSELSLSAPLFLTSTQSLGEVWNQAILLKMPSLRERQEDILPLARDWTESFSKAYSKSVLGLDSQVEVALQNYYWPGNARELCQTLEKTIFKLNSYEASGPLQLNSLPVHFSIASGGMENVRLLRPQTGMEGYTALKKKWSESFEQDYLKEILSRHQGNVSAAAREMKLDRSNFLRLLRKYGIKGEVFRKVA